MIMYTYKTYDHDEYVAIREAYKTTFPEKEIYEDGDAEYIDNYIREIYIFGIELTEEEQAFCKLISLPELYY